MPTALMDGQQVFGQTMVGTGPGATGVALSRSFANFASSVVVTLNGTPQTLIPAPGAGFMIVPQEVLVTVQTAATPYTNGSSGTLTFAVGTQTLALSSTQTTNLFTGSANTRNHGAYAFTGNATAAAAPTNENAAMTVTVGTANLGGGSGTAQFVVYYTIEAIQPTS